MSDSCLITGNLNLDVFKWNSSEYSVVDLIEDTKEDIESENFYQMVQGPTHVWPGRVDSLIYHCWSNRPDKVLECKKYKKELRQTTILFKSFLE